MTTRGRGGAGGRAAAAMRVGCARCALAAALLLALSCAAAALPLREQLLVRGVPLLGDAPPAPLLGALTAMEAAAAADAEAAAAAADADAADSSAQSTEALAVGGTPAPVPQLQRDGPEGASSSDKTGACLARRCRFCFLRCTFRAPFVSPLPTFAPSYRTAPRPR
jgi:hypothetical protein